VAANPAFANRVDLDTGSATDGPRTGVARFTDDGREQDALAEYLAARFSETPFRLGGGDGDDRLLGGENDDTGFGGGGGDALFGEAGADTLSGEAGNDRLEGGDGLDRLFGNEGDDLLVGNDGADALFGGDNNDRLEGGAGDDRLAGEAGDDALVGGAGSDSFVFEANFRSDRIEDFQAEDVIELSAARFADFSAVTAALSQSGADAVITDEGGQILTLQNVSAGTLVADDFRFV